MELWPCGFKIEYTHLGFASAGLVWLGIWNSDHVVLNSSICTSALPRQEQSNWCVRLTQDAYFSLWTHTKQLLLVTYCDTTAETEVSVQKHGRNGRTERRTDGRGSWNSYLDLAKLTSRLSISLWRNLSYFAFDIPDIPIQNQNIWFHH